MGVNHLGEAGLRQEITRLWSAVRKVSRATLQNASIGRAGIRVYDGGWIRIEDGGLQVTGTASVSGKLTGDGTFDWSGPVNLKGAQSVTGPTTFTGKMTVNGDWALNGDGTATGAVNVSGPLNVIGVWKLTGTGEIVGNTSLTGNMAVKSGGSITVQGGGGNVTLSSTYNSPRVNLGGAQIDGGSSFTFTAGTTIVYFDNGTIRIAGMPTKPQSAYPGSFPGAVVVDGFGKLHRIIAG